MYGLIIKGTISFPMIAWCQGPGGSTELIRKSPRTRQNLHAFLLTESGWLTLKLIYWTFFWQLCRNHPRNIEESWPWQWPILEYLAAFTTNLNISWVKLNHFLPFRQKIVETTSLVVWRNNVELNQWKTATTSIQDYTGSFWGLIGLMDLFGFLGSRSIQLAACNN